MLLQRVAETSRNTTLNMRKYFAVPAVCPVPWSLMRWLQSISVFVVMSVVAGALVLAPVPWSKDVRHWLALQMVKGGHLTPAKTIYRTLAWNGDAVGMNNLGVLLQLEFRRDRNAPGAGVLLLDANDLYEAAFSKGLSAGAFNAGVMFFTVESANLHYETAKNFLEAAAVKNDPAARLAFAQHLSVFVPTDLATKRRVLEELAAQNYPLAVVELDDLSNFDHGRRPSYQQRYAAAHSGDFFAVERYAQWLRQNPEHTAWLGWATRAANLGSLPQQQVLGIGYKYGFYGLPLDYAAAAHWLEIAATLSNERVGEELHPVFAEDGFRSQQVRYWPSAPHNVKISAAYELAGLYADGLGVERDVNRARTLLQEPAKIGWKGAQELLDRLDARH